MERLLCLTYKDTCYTALRKGVNQVKWVKHILIENCTLQDYK